MYSRTLNQIINHSLENMLSWNGGESFTTDLWTWLAELEWTRARRVRGTTIECVDVRESICSVFSMRK